MVSWHWCLPVLLCASAQAQAVDLHLCVGEKPQLPFIDPSGGGTAGLLIKMAAQEAGVEIRYFPAPSRRCLEEVRAGDVDGYPVTPYAPAVLTLVGFPMKGDVPDPARATAVVRTLAYRRVGSSVDWDGKRFTAVVQPVLSQYGSLVIPDRLKSLQVPMDDHGKSMEANFQKMLAGRGDIVIGTEAEGRQLVRKPQYAGKIEALPATFSNATYYLSLSKRFIAQHGDVAQRLWDAIGRARLTPQYLEATRAPLD